MGRNQRSFSSIDNGRWFSARYDRRHDLSAVAAYRFSNHWDMSATWVFTTGVAFTTPKSFYIINNQLVKEYGSYNNTRLPDYHRLDISLNYWIIQSAKRKSGFNISVYNCYKRNNPFYMFYNVKEINTEENELYVIPKHKKFYDIIPSISWVFQF